MSRNLVIVVFMLSVVLVVLGCAKQQEAVVPDSASGEIASTGQESVDDVAAGISGVSDTEDELDSSELADLDTVLADIENI